jgi:hypothetical protein
MGREKEGTAGMTNHSVITVAGPEYPESVLTVFGAYLAKIAERLDIKGIPVGQEVPPGIWVSDGSGSPAYNWVELVDKLTERIASPVVCDTRVTKCKFLNIFCDSCTRYLVPALGSPRRDFYEEE